MHPPADYPYIRAFGQSLRLPQHEIDNEIARAHADHAPNTVAYRTADNHWITADEMFRDGPNSGMTPLHDLAAVVIRDRIHTALDLLDATRGPLTHLATRAVGDSTLVLDHATGWSVRVSVTVVDAPPPNTGPSST